MRFIAILAENSKKIQRILLYYCTIIFVTLEGRLMNHIQHPTPSAALAPLSEYDVSKSRGYLTKLDAGAVHLPKAFDGIVEAASMLPALLPHQTIRKPLLEALPHSLSQDDVLALDDAQTKKAMIHYSFMAQAYVWGEKHAPESLPAAIARPLVWLADRLGMPPIMSYSDYVLNNWTEILKGKAFSLDNLKLIQSFLGGMDEPWFILVHVAIEARAGEALCLIPDIIEAVEGDDINRVTAHLETMAMVWRDMQAIFDRMPDQCDPFIYFERVRPYIHGWRDNPALPDGLIYEGVDEFKGAPQWFRGQTGSQSSIVPTMDALLGVGHAADPLKAYLDQLHIYRPQPHRRFIDDIRHHSRLRSYTSTAKNPALTEAYNGIIEAVAAFRSKHLEYAARYINQQSKSGPGNDPNVGTGGTPFMRYLKKHRDETVANLL